MWPIVHYHARVNQVIKPSYIKSAFLFKLFFHLNNIISQRAKLLETYCILIIVKYTNLKAVAHNEDSSDMLA